jgi:DNA topoisomerase-1
VSPSDIDADTDDTDDTTDDGGGTPTGATDATDATDADRPAATDDDLVPGGADAPAIRIFAGDCTTAFEGSRDRTQRGRVVIVIKPDRTTLVHDADGYQPVAWLTRPDSLTVETGSTGGADAGDGGPGTATTRYGPGGDATDADAGPDPATGRDAGGFGIVARTADETLRVTCHEETGRASFPVSAAGVPVGTCPDCGAVLVRSRDVVCTGCRAQYPLPSGSTVRDTACPDCGLPELRVERGRAFDLCLDPGCSPLAAAVVDAFDRVWDCPDCGSPLRVRRARGRVYLDCASDSDPDADCGATFSIPAGVVVGDCDCGLPVFETASGTRCADGSCDRDWTRRPDADGTRADDGAR